MENSYAGFWRRFLAGIIDLFVMVVFVIPCIITWQKHSLLLDQAMNQLMVGSIDVNIYPELSHQISIYGILFYICLGVLIIFNWLYFAISEKSKYQGTLGKQLLGIKVTDINGNKLTFLKSNARYWAKYISTFIFFIGYVLTAFTKKKQALHDIIVKTLVVNKK
jgi:uncharacterized RDD family membrane protein YckC